MVYFGFWRALKWLVGRKTEIAVILVILCESFCIYLRLHRYAWFVRKSTCMFVCAYQGRRARIANVSGSPVCLFNKYRYNYLIRSRTHTTSRIISSSVLLTLHRRYSFMNSCTFVFLGGRLACICTYLGSENNRLFVCACQDRRALIVKTVGRPICLYEYHISIVSFCLVLEGAFMDGGSHQLIRHN